MKVYETRSKSYETRSYESSLIAKRFERARNALLNWQDFDDGSEFAVRDLCLIDQRDGSGVACIIEYNGSDKPENRVGFIAVCSRYATMFVGSHIIVKVVPPDGNWSESHAANESEYLRLMESIHESDRAIGIKCQEMLAVRRQMLLYNLIFPAAIDISVTDFERILVTDAVILNKHEQHIDSMREYISRVDSMKGQ